MFQYLKRDVKGLLSHSLKVKQMSNKKDTQTEESEPDTGFIGDELN